MRPSIFFIIFTTILLLLSCEFELSEEYNADVKEREIPPILEIVELNLGNEDTIYVYADTTIVFSFKSEEVDIKEINFFLDGIIQESYQDDSGNFLLNYDNTSAGNHKIKIQIFTNSNTNSIVDELGAEGFAFETKEWVIFIYKTNKNLSHTIDDGYLKLEWEATKGFELDYFEITVRDGLFYNEIYQTKNNWFIDSAYYGGNYNYYVSAFSKKKKEFFIGKIEANYMKKYPTPIMETKNDSIILKFNFNGIFHTNFTYKLYILNKDINESWIVDKQNINYPYVFEHLKFGDLFSIGIKLFSNFDSIQIESISGYYGHQLLNFSEIYQVSQKEILFKGGNNIHNIFKYNSTQKIITDTLLGTEFNIDNVYGESLSNISISQNGEYLTALGYHTKQFISLEIQNFDNFNILSLPEKILTQSSFTNFPVTNSGISVLTSEYQFHLYNFNTKQILSDIPKRGAYYACRISKNGRYLVTTDIYHIPTKVFEIKDEKLVNPISLDLSFNNYFFNPFDENELVIINENKIEIWNLATHNLEITIKYDCQYINNIDFLSKKVLGYEQNNLIIFDLENNIKLKTINLNKNPSNMYLYNNHIFYKEGVYMIIE